MKLRRASKTAPAIVAVRGKGYTIASNGTEGAPEAEQEDDDDDDEPLSPTGT